MTFKVFQNNTALTVEDLNDVLMEQAVITFNDVSERNNALPSPNPGMHCFLESTNTTYFYHATQGWVPLLPAEPATGVKNVPVQVTPVPGSTKTNAGLLRYSESTGVLTVSDGDIIHNVYSTKDDGRRMANMYLSANYVTGTTGDLVIPRSVWAGGSTYSTGFTPVNAADTAAIGLPTKGVWNVTLNVRGGTTGTGERYAAITKATDHNIRYAAENNTGTGTYSFNMTAIIETAAPMDLHILMFTSAGAITVQSLFQETRLTIYRMSAD